MQVKFGNGNLVTAMAKNSEKNKTHDSSQQYLGTVYAKALLAATETAGNTDLVLSEFDSLLDDVLSKLPSLEALLASPRVPHNEKVQMLDRAFAGKMSQQLLIFLKVVSGHGRLDCLATINRSAHRQYNALRGRVELEIRSAEPLSGEMLLQVSNRLRQSLQSEIDISLTVQPELIGGIVVRVGDTVYDGSVADQLRRLRTNALEKTSQEIRSSLDRFTSADPESE